MTTTFSEILSGVKKLWTVSTGAAADNAAKSGNPIQIGGIHSTTPATRGDGDAVAWEMTSTGSGLVTLSGRNITREIIATAITTTAITNITFTNAAIFKNAKVLHVLASNSLKDAGGASLPVKIAFNNSGIKFTDGTYAMQNVIKTAQAERVGFMVPGVYNLSQSAAPAAINIMQSFAVLGTNLAIASEKGFEWINSGLYINARVEGDVAPASGSVTITIAGEVV